MSNDYDRSESPVATTLPHGETHEFGWTPVGLSTSYTAPEAADAGRRIDKTYDAARAQVALVKPDGTVVSNVYDDAGRPWAVVAMRGDKEEWSAKAYDAVGRLQSVYAEDYETTYEYDSFLVTAEVSCWLRADFEYDDDFRVAKTVYSDDSGWYCSPMAEIDVAYDDDGDVVGIGDLAIDRNPDTGFVESTELGVVSDARGYNGYGENVSYSASFGGEDLYRSSVKRDLLGRVIEREERVLSGDTVTSSYTYDVRGRLVSVTTNGVVSESYAYDANGNRLGGVYDAQDRQLSVGGATYAYDLNGSMTNRNGVALTWNLFGRLMSVGNVSYWRDEQQRTYGKEVDGELSKGWVWSGSRLVLECDIPTDEISVFVYAGGAAPAYMIRGGSTYRFITDNQGSVRLVVNASSGAVAQRLDYDSFGRVIRDTNPGFQPFGFQGGLYDPDTGLVEFGCRWYDAETGRWISKDPILLEGGWNVYAFCDNDPVNRTDPTGLYSAWQWTSQVIGVVSGVAQVIGGFGLATTTGISGVGAVAGVVVCANGAAAAASSIGNLVQMFSFDDAKLMGNSGMIGMTASLVTDDPSVNAAAGLADVGVNLIANPIAFSEAVDAVAKLHYGTATFGRMLFDRNNYGTLRSVRCLMSSKECALECLSNTYKTKKAGVLSVLGTGGSLIDVGLNIIAGLHVKK